MSGHGWVTPLPGGAVARCGGPAICSGCQRERALLKRPNSLLQAAPVRARDQIELVRTIRNQCAAGFSNYTYQVSAAAHIEFWQREQPLAWLYLDEPGRPVGFGLLRQNAGRWFTVVAVLPEFGGRGYGSQITHDIVERCPGHCWATARKDNPAAVKLHRAEDWDVVAGPDPRLVYFRGKRGQVGPLRETKIIDGREVNIIRWPQPDPTDWPISDRGLVGQSHARRLSQ